MITYLAREKIVNRKVVDNVFKRTSKIYEEIEHVENFNDSDNDNNRIHDSGPVS